MLSTRPKAITFRGPRDDHEPAHTTTIIALGHGGEARTGVAEVAKGTPEEAEPTTDAKPSDVRAAELTTPLLQPGEPEPDSQDAVEPKQQDVPLWRAIPSKAREFLARQVKLLRMMDPRKDIRAINEFFDNLDAVAAFFKQYDRSITDLLSSGGNGVKDIKSFFSWTWKLRLLEHFSLGVMVSSMILRDVPELTQLASIGVGIGALGWASLYVLTGFRNSVIAQWLTDINQRLRTRLLDLRTMEGTSTTQNKQVETLLARLGEVSLDAWFFDFVNRSFFTAASSLFTGMLAAAASYVVRGVSLGTEPYKAVGLTAAGVILVLLKNTLYAQMSEWFNKIRDKRADLAAQGEITQKDRREHAKLQSRAFAVINWINFLDISAQVASYFAAGFSGPLGVTLVNIANVLGESRGGIVVREKIRFVTETLRGIRGASAEIFESVREATAWFKEHVFSVSVEDVLEGLNINLEKLQKELLLGDAVLFVRMPDGTVQEMRFHRGEPPYIYVFGPNGAGKTTLVQSWLHLIKPSQGLEDLEMVLITKTAQNRLEIVTPHNASDLGEWEQQVVMVAPNRVVLKGGPLKDLIKDNDPHRVRYLFETVFGKEEADRILETDVSTLHEKSTGQMRFAIAVAAVLQAIERGAEYLILDDALKDMDEKRKSALLKWLQKTLQSLDKPPITIFIGPHREQGISRQNTVWIVVRDEENIRFHKGVVGFLDNKDEALKELEGAPVRIVVLAHLAQILLREFDGGPSYYDNFFYNTGVYPINSDKRGLFFTGHIGGKGARKILWYELIFRGKKLTPDLLSKLIPESDLYVQEAYLRELAEYLNIFENVFSLVRRYMSKQYPSLDLTEDENGPPNIVVGFLRYYTFVVLTIISLFFYGKAIKESRDYFSNTVMFLGKFLENSANTNPGMRSIGIPDFLASVLMQGGYDADGVQRFARAISGAMGIAPHLETYGQIHRWAPRLLRGAAYTTAALKQGLIPGPTSKEIIRALRERTEDNGDQVVDIELISDEGVLNFLKKVFLEIGELEELDTELANMRPWELFLVVAMAAGMSDKYIKELILFTRREFLGPPKKEIEARIEKVRLKFDSI